MSDRLFVFNLGIEDSLWSTSMYISIVFIYVMLGINFASKYLQIDGNSENMECDPNLLTFLWMFSWIFGKESERRVQKCVLQGKQKLAHHIQNPVVQKINDAKYVLDDNMNKVNANMDRLQDAYNKSEGKVNNLAVAIQNNILAIKEGMQKVIAGMMVQKHINDGNLTVVKQTKNYDTLYKQVLDAAKK
jgi:archaellum component FlaC